MAAERKDVELRHLLSKVTDPRLQADLRDAIDRERPFVEIVLEGQRQPVSLDPFPDFRAFAEEPLHFTTTMRRFDGTVVRFEGHEPPTVSLE